MVKITVEVKDEDSITYSIDKYPKTKYVIQKSKDGVWYLYRITARGIRTIGYRNSKEEADMFTKHIISQIK